MCQFKSGIILRNKVVLTPEGNESHSDLLESLGIEDTHMNASKTFIRAELIPKNDDKMADVKDWRYKVDQDIVPDWYEKDPERYEQDFRNAVEEYMNECRKQCKFIREHNWTSVQDGNRTYYFMNGFFLLKFYNIYIIFLIFINHIITSSIQKYNNIKKDILLPFLFIIF